MVIDLISETIQKEEKPFRGVFYRAVWKSRPRTGVKSVALVSAMCNDSFTVEFFYSGKNSDYYHDVYRKKEDGTFHRDGEESNTCGWKNLLEFEHSYLQGNGYRKWNVKIEEEE